MGQRGPLAIETTASPRELSIARRYSWLLVAGYAFLTIMLVTAAFPVAVKLTEMAFHELIVASSPLRAADALAFLVLNFWEPALALFLATRVLRRRRRLTTA